MPIKKINIIVLVLSFCLLSKVESQNYFVSNIMQNEVFNNSSIAAWNGYSLIQLNYRNQWPAANNLFQTYCISYFQDTKYLSGNIGGILTCDQQFNNVLTSIGIGFNYAYKTPIARNLDMALGFKGSYHFDILNYNTVNFQNVSNQEIPANQSLRNYLVNTGVSFLFKKEHVFGLSINNILNSEQLASPGRLYSIMYFSELKTRAYGEGLIIEPIFHSTVGANLFSLNYGANFRYSYYKCGFLLAQNRLSLTNNAILLGISYANYDFVYTYDINLSGTWAVNPKMAAHEVTFLYKFQYNVKRKKHRAIKCPKL